jgi:SAM-dependent methyltransferase
MPTVARYDADVVEWYEGFRPSLTEAEVDVFRRILGRGEGRCLDIGCGTGAAVSELLELGWAVTGVDISEPMLSRARARTDDAEFVLAPAEALPFDEASFDAAVSIWTHTDVDEFGALLAEAARVLRPGAPLLYLGAHPCFVGPHSRFIAAEGVPTLHSGYWQTGRYDDGPALGPDGLRARVGATHLPLDRFLQAFLAAGFRIVAFEEVRQREYPYSVAVGCTAGRG